MNLRVSPSFVVAVLALVLAAGGTGYAAGKITSKQIKDNTIKSRDVRNGALTGVDVQDRSLGRTDLNPGCPATSVPLAGGCVDRAPSGPLSTQVAMENCRERNGRFPTLGEMIYVRAHTELFTWADGSATTYEWTSDTTTTAPVQQLLTDRNGNLLSPVGGTPYYFHCLTF